MSMSTRVYAFVPPDDRHKKYKAIYDACRAAMVDLPEEVERYFDENDPREEGKEVKIKFTDFSDRETMSDGIIVQVADIPKGTVTLKFINRY